MPGTGSDRPRRRRLPRIRWTVRLRLTVLYGGLFLLSGAALLAVTYALVVRRGTPRLYVHGGGQPPADLLHDAETARAYAQARHQHAAELRQLFTDSVLAIALMAVVSVVLGWLMAGRALRPVRTMADRARRISERNLHERLAVAAPDDELKDLADTVDGLLGRLDGAFEAQRRFVANASHELRTPLTVQRALIEVALSDPDADAASLRAVCERVLVSGEGQERLIEALLTLASSQRGLDVRAPLDLCPLVAGVLRDRDPAAVNGADVRSELSPAWTAGAPRLVERLAGNLVDNALRYNVPDGWVRVWTGTAGGRPALRVSNSGPVIPDDRVGALFQPFQRLEPVPEPGGGHGLGLSIVSAIAAAHDAEVAARPLPAGGLDVEVRFPVPPPTPPPPG
ncbi:MAG: sensor histidine kinase [Mycobacteriales bacterium]